MATQVPPKKNTAYSFYVGLPSVATPNTFQANATLATGDAKVSIDGGAFADLTTLPDVDPNSGKAVKVSLSAAEMNGDNIVVILSDASGGEWQDVLCNIQTTAVNFDDINTTLNTIAGYLDTEIAAIKAKTDGLPSDPADASDIAASFATVNATLATLSGYVDTEIAAIKAKTDLLPSVAAGLGNGLALARNLGSLDTFNQNPLPRWAIALQGVIDGTADAKIGYWGDSTYAGSGGGTALTATPSVIAKFLERIGIPSNNSSKVGFNFTTDSRFAIGSWTTASGKGIEVLGGNNGIRATGATATPASFTPADPVDTFRIKYISDGNAAVFTYEVDGGSQTTINVSATAGLYTSVDIPCGSLGTHTLNLRRTSGTPYIVMLEGWNSTRKQVFIYNHAGSGLTTSNMTAASTADWNGPLTRFSLAEQLNVICFMINEGLAAVPTATFKANLHQAITYAQLAGDVILCTSIPYDPTISGGVSLATQQTYVTAMIEVATERNVPVIDIFSSWQNYDRANEHGWFHTDRLHPSVIGQTQQALPEIGYIMGKSFPQTGDSYSKLGNPINTTIAGDIAAVKTVADAINTKTTNLPADPADASDIATAFTGVNTKLDTIDDFLDTEVAAIKAKTDNIPSDPADASDITAQFATVNSNIAAVSTAIGDVPTAAENAAALLSSTIELDEGGDPVSVKHSFQLANAGAAAKTDGMDGPTAHLRSLADDKNRVTATLDGDGNRTATTILVDD